jgi:3-oxoacyl-[acyl-carrier-protein] synthase-3
VLHLRRVVSFVPGESVAVESLRDALRLSDKEVLLFTRFLGLDRIATAGQLTVPDMLHCTGAAALAGLDRSRVRYLIHAHTVPHIVPPGLRHMDWLREKLDLRQARSFTMSHQSCVTALYALKVARVLLRAEPAGSTALIMIGEKVLSPVIQHIPNTTVLGDAGAASVVGLDGPGDAVLSVAHHTLGEFHQAADMSPELQARYLRSYAPTLAAVMREAVSQAGLTMGDISLVLPHNVNRYSWSTAARLLGIPLDRIYLDNVPQTGHCFCADPFLNLSSARAQAVTKPGDTVLMVSAGWAGSFGAAVLRLAELTDLAEEEERHE